MKGVLSQEDKQRLDNISTWFNKNDVVDVSFSGSDSKELGYMEDVRTVLEENQSWLNENAKQKAAKYQ